jgi:hypothetical protein
VTGGVQSSVKGIVPCDVAAPVGLDAWPDLVIDLPDSLPADIEKGRQVGAVSLQDQGETLITVPAVAAENVPPRSFRAGWSRVLSFWPLLPQE